MRTLRLAMLALILTACGNDPTAPEPQPDTVQHVIADPVRPSWKLPATDSVMIRCPKCWVVDSIHGPLIIDSLSKWGEPQPVPKD